MRRWAFGVFWLGLSAAGWLFRPAVFDWATRHVAGQFDPSQIELIANTMPFVASALVVLLVFLVTGRAQRSVMTEGSAAPKAAPLEPATPSGQSSRKENTPAPRSVTRRLYIKPAGALVNSGARFGVVVLPNGTNVRDAAAWPEQEIYFTKLDDRGTLMAKISCDDQRRPQLKCFVDYKGLKFECVKHALTTSRFIMVRPRADRQFRAWFLLPDTKSGASLR